MESYFSKLYISWLQISWNIPLKCKIIFQWQTIGAAFFLKQWGPYNIAIWVINAFIYSFHPFSIIFQSAKSDSISCSFVMFNMISVQDTAGAERFTGLSSFYCRNAGAAILAFDMSIVSTFESLWYITSSFVLYHSDTQWLKWKFSSLFVIVQINKNRIWMYRSQAPDVIFFLIIKIFTLYLSNNTQGILLGRGYIYSQTWSSWTRWDC